MGYLGNTPENQAFGPAVDFFSGTGSQTTFTLSRPVASYAQIQVVVENVPQNPSDAFSVSGNSLNFTSAPPAGTNNIYVYYVSSISQAFYPAPGTTQNLALVVTPTNISPANGSVNVIPSSLTASTFYDLYSYTFAATQWQVSTSTAFTSNLIDTGDTTASTSYALSFGSFATSTVYYWRVRYKNSNGDYSAWSSPFMFTTAAAFPYAADYLVVSGGGGGGSSGGASAGGGGAGGYLAGATSLTIGTAYTVTVGAAGAAGVSGGSGGDGGVSSFNSVAPVGGGGGGAGGGQGRNGGSGGGGGTNSAAGGSGTSGQGFGGGTAETGGNFRSGGGGGASQAGFDGTSGANGGAGSTWLNGTTYAGGGGGGIFSGSGGTGGAGGGGSANSGSATANTGGGGAGSRVANGGTGGSGIVIIRYLGAQRGTGGTVTSAGGYTYHTFTTSGTYTA
jgi:hypothetical protein